LTHKFFVLVKHGDENVYFKRRGNLTVSNPKDARLFVLYEKAKNLRIQYIDELWTFRIKQIELQFDPNEVSLFPYFVQRYIKTGKYLP
jgi:hypothetical protein